MDDISSIILVRCYKFLLIGKKIKTQIVQSCNVNPMFLTCLKFDDVESIKKIQIPAREIFQYTCGYKKFETFKYLIRSHKNDIICNCSNIQNLETKYIRFYIRHLARYTDMTFLAVKIGNMKMVRNCLKTSFNSSVNNTITIKNASEYGHASVVQLLLKDPRIDPTADDNYAIRLASLYGHVSVVQLLMNDKRVDPSADNNDAIKLASADGHIAVVQLLLKDKRVDPTADNNYALRWATENGHTAVVQLLLNDPRVNPSAYNNYGYAIGLASANGHTSIVQPWYSYC
jgi:ankyrin repeat protein